MLLHYINSAEERSMKKNLAAATIDKPYPKPSREDALKAVKTMIAWAGDNPNREGLVDTPQRVVDSYQEFLQAMP